MDNDLIPILTAASYRGLSVQAQLASAGAQPVFVGRLEWPGTAEIIDVVIKLYEAGTCGVANESIGYVANAGRGIAQPARAAILLLTSQELAGLDIDLTNYIDASGYIVCWVTSFEQGAHPFKFVRRLATFSERQSRAFFGSTFCIRLAAVDYVTGNSDRNDGNVLYVDDLHYLAIDQGCTGGGPYWHLHWPDKLAPNCLLELAREMLTSSRAADFITHAVIEHAGSNADWLKTLAYLAQFLPGLLDEEAVHAILDYMSTRADGNAFAESCGRLM
ncbi:hypothetical protein IP91_03910 [Pseudoduganella lurida]|uniref:HipA-like C-terminal domain-containing protein n=1 Tax=Pseudoduganella lurida TaxID=1036180 RepID=A0A562R1Y4_9BURK|nr:hypothetical protein [Pseudoduganella lurida]TWI63069.1 hypothetical protein IP91_03910 [Pseudoduganella lurida]